MIYFAFLQFNRESIDYENLYVDFIVSNLCSDSCQGTSSWLCTGDHQKHNHVWSVSGWAGFGGQLNRGLPCLCASLHPLTRSAFAGCGQAQRYFLLLYLLSSPQNPLFERTVTNSLVRRGWETKVIWISLDGLTCDANAIVI